MHKILVVIRREFIERVRTKWFIVGTVLGPLFMFAVIALPILMAEKGARTRTVVVLDGTSGDFGSRLTNLLAQTGSVKPTRQATDLAQMGDAADQLAGEVGAEHIDGFLLVTDATVETGRAEYRGSNVTSPSDMRTLETVLRSAVFAARLSREGVQPEIVHRAQIPVDLATVNVRHGKVTGESGQASFLLAYMMCMLLYIAIILYGTQVMGSVIEEKTSRVVEVLVSSLKPFHLLSGKVVGVGAVGLLQLGIWLGFGKVMLDHRAELARLLGQGNETAAALSQMSFPEVPIATLVLFLTYFVLGYFLYAAMYAAVAAMANTEAEARQAQVPVTLLLVIPMVMLIGILNDPGGSLALTLSTVPFTSPIVMPVRWAAAAVPLQQVAWSIAILAATVIAITWVAGRIYRVGILMYGKKPGIRELVRWVRG
jgi:ABC-2 type transport system permease protein